MVAALNTGDPDTYLGDLPELVWGDILALLTEAGNSGVTPPPPSNK